jgi:hypothetical protein
MRSTGTLLAILLIGAYGAAVDGADEKAKTLSFAKSDLGKLPAGWKSGATGKGAETSVWKVAEDETAPGGPFVLYQTSKNPGSAFNVCIAEDGGKYKDVDISIAVKAIAGKRDQGGGIIWRVQDKDNFYIVRFNPLEQNFWVYKTVGGKRISFKRIAAKGKAGKWHTIRVVHKGDKMKCYFNGKLLLEQSDDTFPKAGMVGLWSKADAQSYFANVKVAAASD